MMEREGNETSQPGRVINDRIVPKQEKRDSVPKQDRQTDRQRVVLKQERERERERQIQGE